MSNLLPTAEKRLLTREYRLRTVIAMLYALGVLAAISVVSLVPALVRTHSLASSAERARALEEKTLEQLGASTVASEFRQASVELAALAPTPGDPDPSSLIRTIAVLRPAGVLIQSIAYELKGGAATMLTLGGMASNRDDLLEFVEALKGERTFVAVDLPIGDLARERDVRFSLRVTLADPGVSEEKEGS